MLSLSTFNTTHVAKEFRSYVMAFSTDTVLVFKKENIIQIISSTHWKFYVSLYFIN